MPKINPTAIVDPTAQLADDVEIGAYAIVEGAVEIGAGTVLRPHAVVRRFTRMGKGNLVDSFAVLGGEPQDFKFDARSRSYLTIGDGNVFREGVTISRATGEGQVTAVGNGTYWMAGSHAGHNATVGDNVILVNAVALAGHSTVEQRAVLSANSLVHQFTWVGCGVMSQGQSIISQHVPPYVVVSGINNVVGLNVVGLRRWPGMTDEDRRQIREAFNITCRSGLTVGKALERMDQCGDWQPHARHFREFIRKAFVAERPFRRGLVGMRRRRGSAEQTAD